MNEHKVMQTDVIALTQAYQVILGILNSIDTSDYYDDTWSRISVEHLDYALSNQDVYVTDTQLGHYRVWVGNDKNSGEYYQLVHIAYTEAVKLAMRRIINAD